MYLLHRKQKEQETISILFCFTPVVVQQVRDVQEVSWCAKFVYIQCE